MFVLRSVGVFQVCGHCLPDLIFSGPSRAGHDVLCPCGLIVEHGQTSFASVDVVPELDDINIDIDWDKEVRDDTYRASGAGGQHVNKTSSAVRLTHLATNIVVQCQNQRSQHKNRASARKMLVSKLHQCEQAKRDAELAKVYSEKGQIGWGYRIRTYTLQPYRQVKDERTNHRSSDVDGVLDGDLQEFINAELRRRVSKRQKDDSQKGS